MSNSIQMVFCEPNAICPFDFAKLVNGEYVSSCGNQTLAQLQVYRPDMALVSAVDFVAQKEQKCKTPISEISRETYYEHLSSLPPVDWKEFCGVESFKICEKLFGDVTAIYAKYTIGRTERFFTFNDLITMHPQTISERIKQYMADEKAA